jgi:hypothetical protein
MGTEGQISLKVEFLDTAVLFLLSVVILKHGDTDSVHCGVCNYSLCGFHFVELFQLCFVLHTGKAVNLLV